MCVRACVRECVRACVNDCYTFPSPHTGTHSSRKTVEGMGFEGSLGLFEDGRGVEREVACVLLISQELQEER